jgi:hypothetical protein
MQHLKLDRREATTVSYQDFSIYFTNLMVSSKKEPPQDRGFQHWNEQTS